MTHKPLYKKIFTLLLVASILSFSALAMPSNADAAQDRRISTAELIALLNQLLLTFLQTVVIGNGNGGGNDPTTIYAADAHKMRICQEQTNFKNWLGNERGVISEFGISHLRNNQQDSELASFFFTMADTYNFDTYAWGLSDWNPADEPLLPYSWDGTTITNNGISAPFNTSLSSAYVRGINLSGGELSMGGNAEGIIGNPKDHYTYHNKSAVWRALAAKGITDVRYPVRLERLFKSDGSFNELDKQYVLEAMQRASAAGIEVNIDVHNFATMQINYWREPITDSGTLTAQMYYTMMANLATLAATTPAITSIGIMNEPVGVSKADWERYSQGAVSAIRAAGFTNMVYISTWNWGGIQDVQSHSAPWIVDAYPHAYEVHQYFNHSHSGFYYQSYATNEQRIANDGFAAGDCTLAN